MRERWQRIEAFRLRAKLGLFAATATATVLLATALFTVQFFRKQLLSVTSEASSTESDALRIVLEEQMMAGDRTVLNRLVTDIGKSPGIAWVGVLDEEGEVQVSSDARALGQRFAKTSADCQVCHAHAAADRLRSVTLLHTDGSVLRTVTPLVNRPACHECHDPTSRLNGVLIVDRSLDALNAAVVSSRTQVLIGGAAALLALLASLGLAVEHFILGRMRRLSMAARQLGRGDFDVEAVDGARDEMGDLVREFNAMAGRLRVAMEWLAAERKRLEELVNGIGDGLVLVDTELKVITTNHAFAARLPASMALHAGAHYPELARAAGLDPSAGQRSPAERALESGHLEKAIIHVADAPGRFEEIYAQPLRQPDGRITAVIEVWRDITDRRMLEAGLEQSERLAALGILASSVAHEVGNPLASIATAVEGLLRRLDDPGGTPLEELREYLEIVRKQVFRCHGVTQRLLGFARLPSRGHTIVDAAAAAREVLALVGPQARAQKVEIQTSLELAAPASAEDMLLEQVFLNLILNALTAMPTGGTLRVSAMTSADQVKVDIGDSGPGIPSAIRRKLFEPLLANVHRTGGTGLGLFLSQALVHRCGGAITVESRAGEGTVFSVILRRVAEPETAGAGI